jgi:hypothetical protein
MMELNMMRSSKFYDAIHLLHCPTKVKMCLSIFIRGLFLFCKNVFF